MKISHITTLDGDTPVEWWEKDNFKGRVSSITSASPVGLLTKVIPIPDDSILCDFCNAEIKEFPVPVVWGTHAVCKKCYTDIQR